MHLLSSSSTSLDDIVEPVDLGQTPGDIAILSFADSDLAGLAAAWNAEREALPSVRRGRGGGVGAPPPKKPSGAGRSGNPRRRRACQGDRGAAPWRSRLVAL